MYCVKAFYTCRRSMLEEEVIFAYMRIEESCSVPSFKSKLKKEIENVLTLITVILAVKKRIDQSCQVPSFKSKFKKKFNYFSKIF